MAVVLYPHNQTAYEKVLYMLESFGRAAVVHPTGTGKSFIAFKLAENNPQKRIIWLAPSEYIFQSQRENYLEAGGEETALSGITFLTYSKLMYAITENEEAKILAEQDSFEGFPDFMTPDYIVLDEFHRCGAESWGKSVKMLLRAYPNAKLLGLSATHVRYLDNRRDMAKELFAGRIASKMELTQAIAEGILPAPVYVCGLYEYKDELRKLSKRINEHRNTGVRNESLKLLEKLRHSLQQADGPAEIFAKHMKKQGKYIVFCSGREHMEQMISLAGTWYGALDKEPTIYRAIYDNTESPQEVRAFRADQSEHLKLLFCIDMLNEGVHVSDVDGAVLLRPTASPTLYLQQVGRALSVPDKERHQPVIFDMVDNFDSLRCIDSFLEAYHKTGDAKDNNEKQTPAYTFRLIDETRDSRSLFEQLDRCLKSLWEACFEEAERYFKCYGNLKVPKRYICENGISLGSWIATQRRVRAGNVAGSLSKEQIDRLDKIGMEWSSPIGKAWQTGYLELAAYREEHKDTDVPVRYVTKSGYPLGKFVSNQRTAWKNSRSKTETGGRVLSEEREKMLEALGFIWEKSSQSWDRYYAAAKAFYEQEGHLKVPAKYITTDGICLGTWLRNKACEKDLLSKEQVKALEDIGMEWGSKYDAKWDEKFRLAEQYYKEHGNLEIPKDYIVRGVRLGRWVSTLRNAKANPNSSHYRLDQERIRQLEEIGIRWAEDSWEKRYRLAETYYRQHGNLKMPQTYTVETEEGRIWLGKWVAQQRKKRNEPDTRRKLTKEQERRLEGIGMEW